MRPLTRRTLVLAAAALLSAGPGVVCAAEVRTMGVEEAREAARTGELILVDVRTPREWRESGIPDVAVALDMRGRRFVQDLLALRAQRPGAWIGIICATGGRSTHVAGWLARNGVDGVVNVPAGVHTRDGWLARELPVRAPEAPRPVP